MKKMIKKSKATGVSKKGQVLKNKLSAPKKTQAASVSAKHTTKEKTKKDVGGEPVIIQGAPSVRSGKVPQLLPGMHDILPKEEKYWKNVFHTAENLADYFQFKKIETPVLEEAGLFARALGKNAEMVEKDLYSFEDKDGVKVALRPEGTAGVARAYVAHSMWNQVQPVKLWYFAPMFRQEQVKNARYREHYQVGYETFGVKDPAIDAELILVGYNFYKDIGLPVEVRINSLGNSEERARYKEELTNYYRTKRSYLCEDCRQRLNKNPLRLLDCKEEQCQPVKEEAPQLVDWLGAESKQYFVKVLEFLDELSVPYVLTHTLVRGLEYYNDTIFEFFGLVGEEKTAYSLGGGGRYDALVEELGGKATPAAGIGLGVERGILALKELEKVSRTSLVSDGKVDVYFAQLGDDAKRRALKIINDLRASGVRVAFNFFKNSLKSQLEIAHSLKVSHVLILGQKEVQDRAVIIRDMESGVQEIVDQKKIEPIIKRKLGKELLQNHVESGD
jgi:histidyl-tRNA synthetase